MLVHHASKPEFNENGEVVFNEDNDSIAQIVFDWLMLKVSDLAHPYTYVLGWIFTLGDTTWEDYYIELMPHDEAAVYFTILWIIWPTIVAICFPVAVLLSPLYGLVFVLQVIEFAIFVLF